MQNHEGISMKSILLASVSVVGFAGAAAADVAFGGSASVGYNDDIKGGFYWEGDLSVTATRELNGLTASMTFGLNIADTGNTGADVTVDGNWLISVKSEQAGLYFGDTDNAAHMMWSGVDGMEADGFAEADEDDDVDGADAVLRGEVTFGAVTAGLSYGVVDQELEGLQVGVNATFGAFAVGVAYQDEAFDNGSIMGLSVGTTFGAADVKLAYAENDTESSIGVSVGYPIGPVALGAYFASNEVSGDAYGISAAYASGAITVDVGYDVDPGADEGLFDLEATYDVGNDIKLWAGVLDNADAYYVAATVGFGEGASLLVSFADEPGNDADDIGAPELLAGATAKISLSF
jgi:outer membrane protein OmpU